MPRRLSFALLAMLFAPACEQPTSPKAEYRPEQAGTVDHAMCLLGFAAVPLREVVTGHHLVEASINGRNGNFVVDTGANMTVIDQSQADHFGVSKTAGPAAGVVGGMAGGKRASRVAIDGFQIGSIDVRQRRIVAADLGQLLEMLGRVSGGPVHGLIGQDVLKEHRAIVDVARPMLYVMDDDRDPAPVPASRCSTESQTVGTK